METLPTSEGRNLSKSRLLLVSIYNFLLFSLFIFNKNWGIGVTLFEIGHLAPIFVATNNRHKLFYLKMLIAILASFFVWTRADNIVRMLSVITIIGLNLVIFQEAVSGQLISPLYLLKHPLMWIEKLVHYSIEIIDSRFIFTQKVKKLKDVSHPDLIKKIFTGILISIPILFVLIILFASADNNFENLFTAIFNKIKFIFDFEWIKHLEWLFNLLIQSLLFWVYLCLVFPYQEGVDMLRTDKIKRIVEKMTVGLLVAGIFAVFIISQFKSVNFILEGFTTGNLNPSLFVREGFVQLIISCIIGLGVFHFIKSELAKNFITSLLLIEIFLVSLTAGEKVWLYQYKFGLTQARVWGMFFLVFLFCVITSLFLNLKEKIDNKIKWQIFLLSFSTLVTIAGFINVDHLIAMYKPPVVNNKVDVRYMARVLSWDASDLWIEGLHSEDVNYKYQLASNINLFIANNELDIYVYTKVDDSEIIKICSKIDSEYLNSNFAISSNKRKICEKFLCFLPISFSQFYVHNLPLIVEHWGN